jgi:hypothetical protein
VVKKLDELILGMGYEPEPVADRRREILEMLSQNKISASQAQQLLAAQIKSTDASETYPTSSIQGRE